MFPVLLEFHLPFLKYPLTIYTYGAMISLGVLVSLGVLIKIARNTEIVSDQIKRAISRLDTITGRNVDSDLLEQIFSEFCIGK